MGWAATREKVFLGNGNPQFSAQWPFNGEHTAESPKAPHPPNPQQCSIHSEGVADAKGEGDGDSDVEVEAEVDSEAEQSTWQITAWDGDGWPANRNVPQQVRSSPSICQLWAGKAHQRWTRIQMGMWLRGQQHSQTTKTECKHRTILLW